jgi:hypothetical protein
MRPWNHVGWPPAEKGASMVEEHGTLVKGEDLNFFQTAGNWWN